MSTATETRPGPRGLRIAPVRVRASLLVAISAAVAAAVLLPLAFLVVDAQQAGWAEVRRVLFRARTATLLANTVELSVLVTAATGVLGTAVAWCSECLALPARRMWTVLLVLPVAIPDFIVGYAWHTLAPGMDGLTGAFVVMTLTLYPMVYLPVSAALRRTDAGLVDASRSLGRGRLSTFLHVTVPQIRPAVTGGCLVVVLTLLAEYGAFEIVRFHTFTTEVFSEFNFDQPAASALALPLVALGLVVLGAEAAVPRRQVNQANAPTTRVGNRIRPRVRSLAGVLAGFVALIGLGVGVPVGTLIYWMVRSTHTTLPATSSLASATWHTIGYAAAAGLVATALALPVAIMAARRRSVTRLVIERSTFLTQSLPGVVIALSLVFFATRYVFALYQTSTLLVLAYAALFFPLALICVKASVLQVPVRLTEIGRSLGRPPLVVFARVTLPLIAPGLAAGFCLVFLSAVTELTATLVLVPIGVQTLATQFWAFQTETSYGAAAPYAMVIVLIAALPSAVLGLWFDRRGAALRPAGAKA